MSIGFVCITRFEKDIMIVAKLYYPVPGLYFQCSALNAKGIIVL